jgi:alpha-L-fucosidase
MVKAKKEQLEFLRWELGVFFHFGIRTFYEGRADWDGREMPPEGFAPSALDCEQWIKTVKEAGARYAILVCKHHDGFANWPSAYSGYSVAQTPWKDGKGDVTREFTDACRKHDIKIGLYYSPAEQGEDFKNKSAKEYDDYFINQISELLTDYGKIDYLWFDGCGSEGRQYDTERIVGVIRALQPEILLFNMWDPDTRWVGNESGYAHSPNELAVSALSFSVFTETKDELSAERFLPVECDCRMRRENWFYSDADADTVKSLDELIGMYFYTVGRGANLLLNIGPDRRGLLPDADAARLLELGAWIRGAFSNPISQAFEKEEGKYANAFAAPALVNAAVLRESETALGAVRKFVIRAYPYSHGTPVQVYAGDTVGVKAICSFPPFYTQKLEAEITDAEGNAALAEFSAHFVK